MQRRDGGSQRRRVLSGATFAALALLIAGCSGSSSPGTAAQQQGAPGASSAPPLHLLSIRAPHHLHPRSPVRVTFTEPLASTAAAALSWTPKVAGSWRVDGATAVFTPAGAYPPSAKLALTVPGGSAGVRAADGAVLERTATRRFATPQGKALFAEQILARLHFLPLTTTAAAPASPAAERAAVFDPPSGQFAWRWSGVPDSLRSQWTPGGNSAVLRGALLAFQHQHNLTPDDLLGPHTWKALLAADRADQTDRWPYTYIYAVLDQAPQTLTLWSDGHDVLSSPVNGGVAGAPTPIGTYPIYERFTSTTMSGTNPDGSHYSDPGVPWVNYFSGGSAVHGFPRASYGSPQSVGCLELPIPTAERVFDTVNYGTLVTVINTPSNPLAGPPPPSPSASPSSPSPSPSPSTHSPKPSPTHSAKASRTVKSSPTPSPQPSRSSTPKPSKTSKAKH